MSHIDAGPFPGVLQVLLFTIHLLLHCLENSVPRENLASLKGKWWFILSLQKKMYRKITTENRRRQESPDFSVLHPSSIPNVWTYLVVQWFRLHALNAEGPGSMSGQGTRYYKLQVRSHTLQLRQYSPIKKKNPEWTNPKLRWPWKDLDFFALD